MKRSVASEANSKYKRSNLQQTRTSMFTGDLPTFVAVGGVQLQCPYYNRKLLASQGLVAHRHMHERAGDSMHPMQKIKIESQFRKAQIKPITKKVEASSTERISDSPPNAVEANIFHSDSSTEKVTLPAAMASKTPLRWRPKPCCR